MSMVGRGRPREGAEQSRKPPFCGTKEEDVREWAYDVDREPPAEDMEVILPDVLEWEVILALAGDVSCPKRRWFLWCLYCITAMTATAARSREWTRRLETLVRTAEGMVEEELIRRWIQRTKGMLEGKGIDRSACLDGVYAMEEG